MSRIEKALEKAAQLRAGEQPVPLEVKQPAMTIPTVTERQAARLSSSPTVSISTANLMLTTINDPYSVVSEQYSRSVKIGSSQDRQLLPECHFPPP